jgi:sodium-dependent dicarboxylate transporter 2/3/5
VLSAALNKMRLDEWLARWIIGKTGNSVPNLMLGVMGITAFLSMWLSNTAAAAMMLALIIPVIQGLPEGDRYRQSLLLSIAFSANLGGLGTPIGSPPNAIAMQYLTQIDLAPSFGTWMMIGVPGVISMLWISWILLRVLFPGQARIDLSLDDQMPIELDLPFFVVLGTTLLTILGWMTSALHGYSAGTIALFSVVVFFAARILDVKDLRQLSWDVLLLMGGGLCLGVVLSKSGLATWLIDGLPIDDVPVFWLMVIFGTVACLMSSVMSNTATANLMMPIILGLDVEPISPLLIGIAFCCSLAMPLPVSTPPNAMAFGSNQLTVKEMVKAGAPITAIGVVLTFSTGYWWWGKIGLW